jgi:DNA repair photolyase
MVQLCTTVDAWSPEAQQYDLGRECLEAILAEPSWTVRILTKNAAIREDFDLIEKYRDRVLVGLSITATSDKSDIIKVIEPNASPIEDRTAVLKEAQARGFRTYSMFCPILSGISDSPDQIDELVKLSVHFGAEEIFAEPVNRRGKGLILTQAALKAKGHHDEAAHIEGIRHKENWSRYVARLIKNVQKSVRQLSDIRKLRFLLYPGGLEAQDLTRIKADDAGVIWLGKN